MGVKAKLPLRNGKKNRTNDPIEVETIFALICIVYFSHSVCIAPMFMIQVNHHSHEQLNYLNYDDFIIASRWLWSFSHLLWFNWIRYYTGEYLHFQTNPTKMANCMAATLIILWSMSEQLWRYSICMRHMPHKFGQTGENKSPILLLFVWNRSQYSKIAVIVIWYCLWITLWMYAYLDR